MKAFDRWVLSGPFTTRDLGVYRIVFGIAALALLPNAQFLSSYPESFFNPPPGPFRLLDALPPLGVLVALELALALALALVVFGVVTRVASIAAGLLMIVLFGLSYSFGKIDHTIFLPLVALLVVWAGWGSAYSIDSSVSDAARPPRQWPMRLLALLIGVGFATAAAPKVLGGWLRPGTQATEGHYWYELLIDGRDAAFAPLFGNITTPVFWEPLDWITILLEGGILLSVINWRAFRILISFAAVFHVGVLVMMNILFTTNVVAYAAFVPWGLAVAWLRDRGVRAPHLSPRAWIVMASVGVPLLALCAWLLSISLPLEVENGIKLTIIIVGGLVGAAYLVSQAVALVRWISRTRADDRPSGRREVGV
ncbi:hypothetical protein NVV95_04040 [Herbiconiux sp. CPCC 205716]|uniref:HTTM domain-containing protein n=1 Tax=Herbiconiux gentiana TaxID=2970912 RepID=A0ABT2GBZ9_9MICO|nr:hypothetical protein [Herbiconiux gentiana]MCS5713720.1 hypothetical protein [Herbiconiux gentiana]